MANQKERVFGPTTLSIADRLAMLEEYGSPGRDERVVVLLEQLGRAEDKIAQLVQNQENMEARLTRRHPDPTDV